jgi:hypothetical protein
MNPPIQPQTLTTIAKSMSTILKSKPFWRVVAIFSLISLFVMFGLGFACHFIVLGIFMALLSISTVYLPAGKLIGVIIGLPKGKYIFEIT